VGVPGPAPAVADAGPLIHLCEIGRLHIASVFAAVHVPLAVWEEARRYVPSLSEAPVGLDSQSHSVGEDELQGFVTAEGLGSLHRGECEALCLCRRLGVSLLLTDDLAVRDAARRLGLVPVGSLGIVARGFDQGTLSLAEAESSLRALHEESSLFVTPAIVDLVLERVRERALRPLNP